MALLGELFPRRIVLVLRAELEISLQSARTLALTESGCPLPPVPSESRVPSTEGRPLKTSYLRLVIVIVTIIALATLNPTIAVTHPSVPPGPITSCPVQSYPIPSLSRPRPSICLSIHVPIHPSVRLSISICSSIHLSIRPCNTHLVLQGAGSTAWAHATPPASGGPPSGAARAQAGLFLPSSRAGPSLASGGARFDLGREGGGGGGAAVVWKGFAYLFALFFLSRTSIG